MDESGSRINPKKILILKNCCIGDVLMTTPLIKTLAKNYPNAKIDYMVGDWSRFVLKHNLYINKLYHHILFSKLSIFQKIKNFFDIRREKYDVVFVLDIGKISILFAKFLGGRQCIGFNVNNQGRFLNKSLTRNPLIEVHEIDYYLNLSKLINDRIKIYRDINLHFSKSELLIFAQKFNHYFNSDRIKIGISAGGGQNPYTRMSTKRWPVKNYMELIIRLNKKYNNLDFFIFGDKSDTSPGEAVEQEIPHVINLTGRTAIRETAYFISKQDFFLTNDSSLMHLAAAFNVKTLALFGPTNPIRLCPFNIDYIWHRVSCSPCFIEGQGLSGNCNDNICMQNISVTEVYEYIDVYVAQIR